MQCVPVQVAKKIPLDRLVLETDSPHFSPRGNIHHNMEVSVVESVVSYITCIPRVCPRGRSFRCLSTWPMWRGRWPPWRGSGPRRSSRPAGRTSGGSTKSRSPNHSRSSDLVEKTFSNNCSNINDVFRRKVFHCFKSKKGMMRRGRKWTSFSYICWFTDLHCITCSPPHNIICKTHLQPWFLDHLDLLVLICTIKSFY